ncbi:MAG: HAD family hydrolase [Planctomycetes bacterium]|nr:HAD family hydrolase [Planctomycetota bacterium]MBM4064137.1 HAD family hydrolase [Planctomycetota bacterium]
MSFKAIIFDLDGTLIDSLEDLGNATNRVLLKNNFPTHTMEDYRYFVGEGVVALITRALPEEIRDEATINACVGEFREDYRKNWNIKTKLYEGIAEMLDSVTLRGLKMAVLSNKPDYFTKKCVAEFLPKWNFERVIGQRDNVPKKPDPAGADEIAEHLAILPSEILYLGDTPIDMKTATAAGMFPVGVLWGFRPEDELKRSGAQRVIHKPQELMKVIDH